MVAGVVIWVLWMAPNTQNFWLPWELGSVGAALVYTIIFYARLFLGPNPPFNGLGRTFAFIPVFCFFAVSFLGFSMVAAYVTTHADDEHNRFVAMVLDWLDLSKLHVFHLLSLVMAALFFCVVDFIFGKYHARLSIREEFMEAFYFNGLPVFVGFLVLFIFIWQFDDRREWSVPIEAFTGGAIALETLISNTIFAILFWR